MFKLSLNKWLTKVHCILTYLIFQIRDFSNSQSTYATIRCVIILIG